MAEFRCWIPEYEEGQDEADVIHAFDAWSAAKRFAEKADQNAGGEIATSALRGNNKLRIHVLSPEGIETMWDVWPEAEIRWYGSAAGVAQ